MTGILFYLLRSSEKRDELQREVRGAFKNTRDMDVASLLKFPYLQAVLKEGMRIHPAVPQGLPRVSPGIMIEGIFVPRGVSGEVSFDSSCPTLTISRLKCTCLRGHRVTTNVIFMIHTLSNRSAGSIQNARM
jgi:hypothetical protein